MPYTFGERLAHAWNAFINTEPVNQQTSMLSSFSRPDRHRYNYGNERSIVTSIYNRIAMDVAQISIQHVKVDSNGQFTEIVNSELNYCLTTEANIDQTGRAFIQDICMSMFDEGCVAVVPIELDKDPFKSTSYGISNLRCGKIREWYPDKVKVEVYNEKTAKKQTIILPKKMVAIIENPFYSIMNEPNSICRRLIRKMNILDSIDEKNGSGKLDLIIQLPYMVKSENRKKQAEQRRADLENQLANSKYGIAYTDGTEHIQQLNRSLENNLLSQIKYLSESLFAEMGLDQDIFSGKATEQSMINYYTHTVEPVLSAITDEFNRKFLTKTARTQRHAIKFYRNPFKLVPVNNLADMADKFTRNEVLSSNEVRAIIGYKPVNSPQADELRNKNLNAPETAQPAQVTEDVTEGPEENFTEEVQE